MDARLPVPSRDLPQDEVAIVRGEADAMALRLRHHDDGVHAKRQPAGKMARAIFNAVEQARGEAIGARTMAGVAANLGRPRRALPRARLSPASPTGNERRWPKALGMLARER